MFGKKLIYGVYDDADKLMTSVKEVRSKGVEVFDCYTPFPVHGLDRAMGIRRSLLTVGAFICGALGAIAGISLQVFTNVFDWPINVGGKPFFSLPSFIPVTFELTILFTAFGIGILFFIRSKMVHGIREDVLELRQTDDLFVLAIDADKLPMASSEVGNLLISNGAIEIKERDYDL